MLDSLVHALNGLGVMPDALRAVLRRAETV